MTVRLLLALLMILSAPLAAVQHVGCGESGPDTASSAATDMDGHDHHRHDHHRHDHHRMSVSGHDHHAHANAADALASETAPHCDSCDLACLSACASVAMPASLSQLPVISNQAAPDLPDASELLLSHPLPLLRPPTHS